MKITGLASDHGIGCVFGNMYIYDTFDNRLKQMPIVRRELYAVAVACATWGHHLLSKRLMLHWNNEAVVYCINKGV